MPQTLVGLDIGTHSIKVAELSGSANGYRLKRYFERRVEWGRDGSLASKRVSETLRKLFEEKKIDGDAVVAGFPGNRVSFRVVDLPFTDRRKIEMTVPFEIENDIPFSLNDVVVDHIVVSQGPDRTQVLTATVQKKDLKDFLETLAGAGLDPKAVDLDVFGLFHFHQQMDRKPYPAALVDIGHSKTLVCVVEKDRIRMVKPIPFGGAQLRGNGGPGGGLPGELSEELVSDVDEEAPVNPEILDTLVDELNRMFYNFEHQEDGISVPTVLLSGGGAANDDLIRRLSEGLGKKVELVSLKMMKTGFAGKKFSSHFPVMVVPIGMAMRAGDEGSFPFTLRKGEFSHRGANQALQARAWVSGVLGGVALLLLLLNLGLTVWQKEKRYSALEDQIRATFKRAQPEVTRIVDPSQQMKNLLADLKKKADLLGQASRSQGTFLSGLNLISTEIPENVKVKVFEMLYIPGELRLLGETESYDAVERMKGKFEQLPGVGSVDVSFAGSNIQQSGVKFRMIIGFK